MFEEYQHEEQHHVVHYGKDEVDEFDDVGVPTFLKITYLVLPIWGILWFYSYWNGSHGWLDRGYWQELERVAQTKLYEQVVEERDPSSVAEKEYPVKK